MDIEAKIALLSEQERELFDEALMAGLTDFIWMRTQRIPYVYPERHMEEIKGIVYDELGQRGLIQIPQAYSSQQSETRLE